MHDHLSTYNSSSTVARAAEITQPMKSELSSAIAADAVERAASFGRWWFDVQASQLVLSVVAAGFLDVEAGWHASLESGFAQVVPDDVLMLISVLTDAGLPGQTIDCEFRVINEQNGMRWLRIISLPQALSSQHMLAGVLVDTTSAKHAAMRERFSFESTQLLIGTHTLGEAVTKVIRLVCEDLGWDCGAYWSLEQGDMCGKKLVCTQYWTVPDMPKHLHLLRPFMHGGRPLSIAPGQGLVGRVWSTGRACWIEDVVSDPDFLYPNYARDCGLRSGYAFPVAYESSDGRRNKPGVLVFFSSLARQGEAQLPNLSAAIGGLIAQTAQRLEQQERISRLAQFDGLTGLANRSYFHYLLDAACLNATQSGQTLGVLYVDLDRFKPINDALGHEAGDAVLREFAQRLALLAPQGCHAGRVGGDEFAILLYPAASVTQLGELAEAVLRAAATPFIVQGSELAISASIGISVFPDNGRIGPELLRSADAAMYRIKQNGRNALSFFSGGTFQTLAAARSSMAQQLTMEADLHHALARNEFFLEYQPVFDSTVERMVAVEALIRWRRTNGEIVRPDIFIPVAEESRLIVQIGRWVVEQACRDLALLHRSGFADLQVNVNMAAPEFINLGLPEELTAIVETSGIAAHHLCLELTEGMVMSHPDKVIPVMHALRQRGFKISLDDFGMGHSSLSRLKNLPISSVKIDRSFVGGLPHEREDGAIVRTILDIGRNMGLLVIAEGVETDAQLDFLRQCGCTLVQGFLLSGPLAVPALLEGYDLGQAA